MNVLDLFSGACGGWSLGLDQAGFTTVAACEVDEWRRRQFARNFPGARLYSDICELSAERLRADGVGPIDLVCGSPPCQDASTASTKGRGIEGERTGLYLEAVRLVREIRPRWYAFENVPGIRNRGIDRVLGLLEQAGYASWPLVVGAHDLGAPHIRQRSWVIGADAETVQRLALPWDQPDGNSERAFADDDEAERRAFHRARNNDGQHGNAQRQEGAGRPAGESVLAAHTDRERVRQQQLSSRSSEEAPQPAELTSPDSESNGRRSRRTGRLGAGAAPEQGELDAQTPSDACEGGQRAPERDLQPRQSDPARRIASDARGVGSQTWTRSDLSQSELEVAIAERVGPIAETWNGGIAGRLRMDDGLPKGMARPMLAAFGDAVVPQIAEIIGRAILATEGI